MAEAILATDDDAGRKAKIAELQGVLDGQPVDLLAKKVVKTKVRLTTLSRRFLRELHTTPDGVTLRWYRDEFYEYVGTHYRTLPDSEMCGIVLAFLDVLNRGDPDHFANATPRLAENVVKCLASEVRVPFDVEPPVFLGEHGNTRHNWVAMRNGLLNLDDVLQGKRVTLAAHTPKWFSTFALPYDCRSDAECPIWFETLNAILDGDEERVDLLAQWFGYVLTEDTTLHAILLIEGPPRSGKGTILRTMAATIGHDNCVSPRLSGLAERFGLADLQGKRLACCPDAHLGHGDKALATLELLKLISGEDAIAVERKFKPSTTVRLRTRFALAVNELPKFGDNAGALGSRVHIVPCRNSFMGREDRHLEGKLAAELPGIFRWALEGLVRLRQQGEFTKPQISRDVEADFARLVSPLRAFVEDRCEVRPGLQVERDRLWEVWKQWCEDNGHLAGSRELLGSRLRAMIPNLDTVSRRDGVGRTRCYVGLGLRNVMAVP